MVSILVLEWTSPPIVWIEGVLVAEPMVQTLAVHMPEQLPQETVRFVPQLSVPATLPQFLVPQMDASVGIQAAAQAEIGPILAIPLFCPL